MRPRLAVAAVLAAFSVAAGAYYLWPQGRHLDACAPEVPVSEAVRQALDSYAGRIRHDVEHRDDSTGWHEVWYDPETGAQRDVSFDDEASPIVEIGTIRRGKAAHAIWVAQQERTWYSSRDAAALVPQPDVAAVEARTYRDRVARGRARVIGRRRIRGQATLDLHETVVPLRLSVPGSPPPIRPIPPLQIDTWVDRLTYVPLRTRMAGGGHWTQIDTTWLPRTAANIAETRVVIPHGFRRVHPSTSPFTHTVLVSRAPCT